MEVCWCGNCCILAMSVLGFFSRRGEERERGGEKRKRRVIVKLVNKIDWKACVMKKTCAAIWGFVIRVIERKRRKIRGERKSHSGEGESRVRRGLINL